MKGQSVGEAIQAMIDGGAEVKSVQLPAAPARSLPDVEISEKDFQQVVIGYAQERGWSVRHVRKVQVKRKNGLTYWETAEAANGVGFPDLTLVRERVLFPELKTDKGTLSEDQKVWRDKLLAAGAEWRLWRPRDWPDIVKELT